MTNLGTSAHRELAERLQSFAVLRKAEQLDQFESLANELRGSHPETFEVFVAWCDSARLRKQNHEFVSRTRTFLEHFPDRIECKVHLANALIGIKDYAQADATLSPQLSDNSQDFAFRLAHARATRPDSEERAQRMQQLLESFPTRPDVVAALAQTLRGLGRVAEADKVLDDAIARLPSHVVLEMERARSLDSVGRYEEAFTLWQRLKGHYPNNKAIQRSYQVAHLRHAYIAAEAGTPVAVQNSGKSKADPSAVASAMALSDHDLVLQFEALGNACEFGVVQREFGAEPLGLLRWSGITPANLKAALLERFQGIGEPEHTKLHVVGTEYVASDARYHLRMHTFVNEQERPAEVFHPLLCKRQRYLRDKLIDDLEDGEKIFVYHHPENLPDDDICGLGAAVRTYGDNCFVCIQVASGDISSRTIRRIDRGIYVGYIDYLVNLQVKGRLPAFASWADLCRQLLAAWRQEKSAQAASPQT